MCCNKSLCRRRQSQECKTRPTFSRPDGLSLVADHKFQCLLRLQFRRCFAAVRPHGPENHYLTTGTIYAHSRLRKSLRLSRCSNRTMGLCRKCLAFVIENHHKVNDRAGPKKREVPTPSEPLQKIRETKDYSDFSDDFFENA